jgi:hypothetical protein
MSRNVDFIYAQALSHAALHAAATEPYLYGITRGKKLVMLIGQKKALGIAVHNDRPQRRYSGLLASLGSHEQRGVS